MTGLPRAEEKYGIRGLI